MKKTIYILIIFILSCSSNLLAGEIIDTQFSEISDIYNVEYTGEVVKLTISGIRPVAGSLTGGRVINIGPPLFSSQAINQPTVLRDGSVYKMWLSGGYSGVARIGYAFSYDGLNWTIYSNTSLAGLRGAVIGPENGPLFCADDENDSTVIKDGLIYKMWFGGQQTGTFRIGYATSSDGINWTVYSNASGTKGSVLEGGSPGFASSQVQDPMVIKDGSIYKMWFTGIAGSISRIGYATSSDGINWTIYSNTSNTNGSIIDVGKPSFASNNVYDPCVIKDGTSYKMWFTGSKDGERIGYATSSDGINWSIHSNSGNPNGSFLDRGYPSFLSANVGAPTVIRDGAQYKIWYDNNSDGIGYGMITFDQSGCYTSSIMDAGDTVSLDKLYYEALLPSNTYIKFQIRGGKTLEELNSAQFTGPEKSFSTYYSFNGETVDGITNIQYIQYKVWFSTGDDTYSPELQLIRFTYSDAGWGNNDDSTLYTFPSPYKPDVSDLSIRYSLEKDAEVNIKVYSRNGKEVWSKDSTGTSGWNVTSWNGKSSGGKTQGSGVYLCVITKRYPEGDKSIKSMILLVR